MNWNLLFDHDPYECDICGFRTKTMWRMIGMVVCSRCKSEVIEDHQLDEETEVEIA